MLARATGLDPASAASLGEDRRREFELGRRVLHGPITRLVARDQLATMTRWALGHQQRTGTVVAVIVADVSGLAPAVRGSAGPDVRRATDRRATEWLTRAAGRMLAVVGPTATAAQVGPGEFAFLRHDLRDPAQASEIAGQICDAARDRLVGPDGPDSGTVTIGIAVAAQHDTAETLISGARRAARPGP